MIETIRTYLDLRALLIILTLLLVSGTVGLWFVKKTTGRSVREMLALLGARIFLMLPVIFMFRVELN